MNEELSTSMEVLAQRLSQLREEAKIPRQKAANDLGISRNSLEYYEKGKRTPDANMVARLAQYYGVSMDYLLGFSEYRNPENEKLVADLHLSDKTIELLKTNDGDFAKVLDMVLSYDWELSCQLIVNLQAYIESAICVESYIQYKDVIVVPGKSWEEIKSSKLYSMTFSMFHQMVKRNATDRIAAACKTIIEELEKENRGKDIFTHSGKDVEWDEKAFSEDEE